MTAIAWVSLPILIPLLASALLKLVHDERRAGWLNLAATLLCGAAAGRLLWLADPSGSWLWSDRLAALSAILTAILALGAAFTTQRFFVPFQALLAALMLAALARDPILLGAALVAATLIVITAPGAADFSGSRGPTSRSMARSLLSLAAIGLLFALFGLVLLELAAGGDLVLLNLGGIFLLLGAAGIAAMAGWPAADGALPIAGPLRLALVNILLVVLLRLRFILADHAGAIALGPLLIGLGLLALLTGLGGTARAADPRRAAHHAAHAHCGLVAIGIGVGTPAAIFAALLHLGFHTLAQAAAWPARPASPAHRAASLTLAALPPGALFASSLLLLIALLRHTPWLALIVGAAMLGLIAALLKHVLASGREPASWRETPTWILLALLLGLGVALPDALTGWLTAIAAEVK